MNTKQREQVAAAVERAMRSIQVADDELDDAGRHDMDFVREMVQRCKDQCETALAMLPSPMERE